MKGVICSFVSALMTANVFFYYYYLESKQEVIRSKQVNCSFVKT